MSILMAQLTLTLSRMKTLRFDLDLKIIMFDVWFVVFGAEVLKCWGVWCLVFGVWCLVLDVWCWGVEVLGAVVFGAVVFDL